MSGFQRAALAAVISAFFCAVAAPTPSLAEPATSPGPRFSAKDQPVARKPVPCTCRFQGDDYQFGQTICIRGKQATCDRVLNNTSWQFSEKPCLYMSAIGQTVPRG